MGYRLSQALIREYGLDVHNTKDVVAEVGQQTCAIDAVQLMCGCTVGKRNLRLIDTGKASFTLRSMSTGRAIRLHVSYWDSFDQQAFKKLKQRANAHTATEMDKSALQQHLEQIIQHILTAQESELFSIRRLELSVEKKQTGFQTLTCDECGESVDSRKIISEVNRLMCTECAESK